MQAEAYATAAPAQDIAPNLFADARQSPPLLSVPANGAQYGHSRSLVRAQKEYRAAAHEARKVRK